LEKVRAILKGRQRKIFNFQNFEASIAEFFGLRIEILNFL